MGTGRPITDQTSAMIEATNAKRRVERIMGGCFGVGGCDIAALCTALNQLDWFVRLRSDKLASCRWTAKILVSNGKIDNRLGVEHLHMRFAFRTAAALMAGGFLLISAISASAQSQGAAPRAGEQKPPDQAQGEQKPPIKQRPSSRPRLARLRRSSSTSKPPCGSRSRRGQPNVSGPDAGLRACCGATMWIPLAGTSTCTTASVARRSI